MAADDDDTDSRIAAILPDETAMRMHRVLARYHDRRARDARLDVIHEYHADLADRLTEEAKQITERMARAGDP